MWFINHFLLFNPFRFFESAGSFFLFVSVWSRSNRILSCFWSLVFYFTIFFINFVISITCCSNVSFFSSNKSYLSCNDLSFLVFYRCFYWTKLLKFEGYSITSLSSARIYRRVVLTSVWPIRSLITSMGTSSLYYKLQSYF